VEKSSVVFILQKEYNEHMQIKELGHVVLYVSNLKISADFYKETLGFKEIHRDLHTALFSSGRTHHEMLLIEVGGKPKDNISPTPGLYHIGFKIGDTDEELRIAIDELQMKGVEIQGSANHHVTHSIYIMDPDNNELELYIDVDEDWKVNPSKIIKRAERLVI
jgi:catechol-2,3-dioxygenase